MARLQALHLLHEGDAEALAYEYEASSRQPRQLHLPQVARQMLRPQ